MANTQTARPKKNILIATLGATPDIMKEALGVFCYDGEHDLYALMDPANAKDLADLRDRNAQKLGCANSVDELWLVTPDQKPAEGPAENEKKDGLEVIREWCKLYAPCASLQVKLWRLRGADDIKDESSARGFHDLMLRVMCYARSYNAGATNLMVCLAGGRKTMSADLQDAVYCFGCETLLHVLSFNQEQVGFPKPKEGEKLIVEMRDGSPIDKDQVRLVKPVLLESFNRNPLFESLVRDATFKDLFNDQGAACDEVNGDISVSIMETCFLDKVQDIRDQAKYFYSSFTQEQEYAYDNFPILYTLSHETQDVLKKFKVGAAPANKLDDLELLKTLPKSDLHCHLGGCLTVEEMVAVAATIRGKIDAEKSRNSNFRKWVPKGPKTGESWKEWRSRIADELQMDWRLVAPAYILSFEDDPGKLEQIIYGDYIGPDGENDDSSFVGIAIPKKKVRSKAELAEGQDSDEVVLELTPYEILGDLQGTSLLCHKETLRKTVEILLQKSYDDGLRYLEIRCSPINYASKDFSRVNVVETVLKTIDAFCSSAARDRMRVSIMFIASRHADKERVKEGIELCQHLVSEEYEHHELFKKYFRGFDLAGNESAADPKEMRDVFEDVMQDCLNITIHAGETMPVDKIWQAVYYLNAERIGHGLTLIKDPEKLMKKFRERRIGIEMCPSSNYQVVGFRDNYLDSLLLVKGRHLEPYPLKKYLQAHLRVSVNTDDPGISRTCMTKELLKAGRLTCEGLSLWEILSLLYNGFDTAFLPYEEKNQLLNEMNEKVRRWIKDNIKEIETKLARRG